MVAFRAESGASGNATSVNVTIPAVQVGDLMLLFWAGVNTATPTTPTGWTLVDDQIDVACRFAVYQRVAQSGDAGATVTCSTGATIDRKTVNLVAYSGVASLTGHAFVASAGTGTTHTTPARTTTGLAVEVSAIAGRTALTGTPGWTPPAGITERADRNGGALSGSTVTAVGDNLTETSAGGSIGSRAWTLTQTIANVVGYTIELAPTVTAANATASGSWGFTGSATGASARSATGGGGFTFTGSAVASTTRSATATGAFSFTGTASATSTRAATATGGWGFAGSATGATTKAAAASGGFSFTGSATGSAPVVGASSATATGLWAFTSTATAVTSKTATAAGVFTYLGAATASAPALTVPAALASGTWGFIGTAAGTAPTLEVATATATGTWRFTGSAWAGDAPEGRRFPATITTARFPTDPTVRHRAPAGPNRFPATIRKVTS